MALPRDTGSGYGSGRTGGGTPPPAPTGPPNGQSTRLVPLGNGWLETQYWDDSTGQYVSAGPDYMVRDYSPDADSGSGGYAPQAYGSTESGFLASLDLENRQLNETIRANQQRLDEIRLQEEAAGGRLDRQLSAERDRLNDQLAVTREQLAENKRQFDEELSYKRTYDDRSLGLSERDVALRELTGERNYGLATREQDLAELTGERSYEVSLANLDLQGQQLAINARKNELDHEVDLGRLSVEQARVQLEGEIAQGQLQLGRERLQVEREGLALQGELGRGDLALREKLGLGELDISRQRLGLDTELGRGELAVRRQAEMRQLAATYSDQFGKDPVRQALFSLGLKGGMSPQEAAFRSLGLATGGGGSVRPMAQQQGILTGEAGPEVVTQTPEGDVQVLPIVGQAAGGGTFNIKPRGSADRALNLAGRTKRAPSEYRQDLLSPQRGLGLSTFRRGGEAPAIVTPAPAPDIRPAQPPGTTGGAGQPYTPNYDPTNPGWDSILADIQANADATAKTTGDALGRALGVQGITIDRNKGVLGLPTAQKAARAYLESGIPVQNLITSGYSVGGEYGGTPAEEFLRQIMDVTPRGALQY